MTDPVRVLGEEKQWSKLYTPFIDSDDYTGWEMTAIAVHLLNAKGSYRFPTGLGFAYLLYRDIGRVV